MLTCVRSLLELSEKKQLCNGMRPLEWTVWARIQLDVLLGLLENWFAYLKAPMCKWTTDEAYTALDCHLLLIKTNWIQTCKETDKLGFSNGIRFAPLNETDNWELSTLKITTYRHSIPAATFSGELYSCFVLETRTGLLIHSRSNLKIRFHEVQGVMMSVSKK